MVCCGCNPLLCLTDCGIVPDLFLCGLDMVCKKDLCPWRYMTRKLGMHRGESLLSTNWLTKDQPMGFIKEMRSDEAGLTVGISGACEPGVAAALHAAVPVVCAGRATGGWVGLTGAMSCVPGLVNE
eukprot:3144403-Amphidinium_carterae.3